MIILIKLKKDKLYKLGQDYYKLIINDIRQRYYDEKSKATAKNPFTGLSYITLFENESGEFNEEMIKTLLYKPIIAENSSFEQINSYILTGKLVFYSNFSVDKVLKDSGLKITKDSREKVRKEFVNKYSNKWLNKYKVKFPNYYKTTKKFHEFIKCIEGDLISLNNEISKIINYKYLRSEIRHYIICSMGVDVCPYCNRQYITSYLQNGNRYTTADLDHFLPKSLFALLSLSLFNFIPACQICNSRFKVNKRAEILYPYENGFENNAYFTIETNAKSDFDSIIGNNDFFNLTVNVEKNSKNRTKIYNNIETFKIKEVYQIHKQYVRELIYKKTAYNKTYKDMLSKLMKDMKLSDEEIDLFLYGYVFTHDELYKKPLAKLTYDIIRQYK